MKILLLSFFLILLQHGFSQEKFQLAPPLLKYASRFFSNNTRLEILFNQPGAEVRYTTNGKEPTEKDLLYTSPILIAGKQVRIRAKAMGRNFLPSDNVSAEFFKQGKSIRQISFAKPNAAYPGSGKNTLNDIIGGLPVFTAATWLGYNTDSAEIYIELTNKEKINMVLVDVLQKEGSWIFLPEQILLYYYNNQKKTYLLLGKEVITSNYPSPDNCSARKITPTKSITTNKLKLVLYSVKKIPDWHAAKGTHGWLFIDEVIVY